MNNELISLAGTIYPIEQRLPQARQQQVANDEMLIYLWLHSRSARTQAAYRRDVAAFLPFIGVDFCRLYYSPCGFEI